MMGEFDLLVLQAIRALGSDAYGITIRSRLGCSAACATSLPGRTG
jgi:hypothetical protein